LDALTGELVAYMESFPGVVTEGMVDEKGAFIRGFVTQIDVELRSHQASPFLYVLYGLWLSVLDQSKAGGPCEIIGRPSTQLWSGHRRRTALVKQIEIAPKTQRARLVMCEQKAARNHQYVFTRAHHAGGGVPPHPRVPFP
jgi:hypothetical protein